MANNRQFDGLEWSSLDFPYNRVLRPLSEDARIVSGQNCYISYGGTMQRRPGTVLITNTTLNKRIDRLWTVETLESPPKIYLLCSAFDSGAGTWGVYYNRLDGGSPGWTALSNLRHINDSTRAHEAVVSRGKLYIKGYPSAGSGEKLGTVIFDGSGSGISVYAWGLLGPQVPARITGTLHHISGAINSTQTTFNLDFATGLPGTPFNMQFDYELMTVTNVTGTTLTVIRGAQGTTPTAHVDGTIALYRDWSVSGHTVVVNLGWEYTYAYVSVTGHVSNRAPLETDPTQLPSNTGPFLSLIPKITVQGTADTTNVPYIQIYRTTDGGGTFLPVEQIANTGAGAITYQDKSVLGTDPVADTSLNTQSVSPSLTSNSPPPTVIAPAVTGTDTPVESTPIAYYAGRFWMGIGNYLFYSANEELNIGVPEEAWPSGLFGNFFLFQHRIQNLVGTTDALYIVTSSDTYELTGTLRETFNPKPILNELGAPYGHPRSATKYQDAMVWLTNDLRIALLQGQNFKTISDPLGADLVNAISAGAEIEIRYWAELEKEFIIVCAHRKDDSTQSRQWVYDAGKSAATKQEFWNTPWTIASTACLPARTRESSPRKFLVFVPTTGGNNAILTYLASLPGEDNYADVLPIGPTSYTFSVDTALFMTPPGNHVNALRRPALYPNIEDFRLERTVFGSESDPTVSYFLDDLWTTPVSPPTPLGSPRAQDPKGYKTLIYQVNQIAKRIAIRITYTQTTGFEIQNLAFVFEPDKGV